MKRLWGILYSLMTVLPEGSSTPRRMSSCLRASWNCPIAGEIMIVEILSVFVGKDNGWREAVRC